MPSLSLPPRGVFVPTSLIYATNLSPAAFHTWVQLRGLAWQGGQTPPCSIQDLCRLTGKSPSALYGHLAMLKSCGALRWRSTGRGILTIVFDLLEEQADLSDRIADDTLTTAEAQPRRSSHGDLPVEPAGEPSGEPHTAELDSRFRDSRILESGLSSSLNPVNINLDSNKGLRERGKFQDSRNLEPGAAKPPTGGIISSDVVAIYRELTGRRPNQIQRAELLQRVTDPDLWRRTLAHWQVHGWNPGNFAGLLDLYQRGGPEACHFCGTDKQEPTRPAAAPRRRKPIDDLIDELQQDPKEVNRGRPPRTSKNP